jgi:transglutaminase-like putative cysteine protease
LQWHGRSWSNAAVATCHEITGNRRQGTYALTPYNGDRGRLCVFASLRENHRQRHFTAVFTQSRKAAKKSGTENDPPPTGDRSYFRCYNRAVSSEKLFQILSYAAVFCGFFALWISGVFGLLGTALFFSALFAGWFFEGTRWHVSERLGTVLIVLALPAYYVLWRAGFFAAVGSESALPGVLARLIVTLSAIKLLQRKSDRDWIFLYIMSFFQVLLAAGLSISAMYFVSFIAYIFLMVCTIIVFEIRKTGRNHMHHREIHGPAKDQRAVSPSPDVEPPERVMPVRRVPATALVLIFFIIALAAPMFFLLPRVGGAGFGGSMGGGAETSSGFSDTVRLGGIGRIQQNDEIIMRVRVDGTDPAQLDDIRWRGIALDRFDNQSWRKSKPGYSDQMRKGDREFIQVDTARGRDRLVLQTVYLEPINSPVMFMLPRGVGVQTGMPYLLRDSQGALSFMSKGERISYRVLSDVSAPETAALRRDNGIYSSEFLNYLELPETIDPRIAELASEITRGTRTRYDAAQAVETYLQTQFGYTLEQKAGGDEPLADFLFNVREGHCEYFSTAMAVMLRTQGIATRVVNGFQRGDYNETADVFVVRQRNAHSWVEVYFPGEDAWVTFDPTPFAGQNLTGESTGIAKRVSSYLEALETFWIQYFVAYDSAEQRSLLTSVRRGVADYGKQTTGVIDAARERFLEWWRLVRGDAGFGQSVTAVGYGVAFLSAAVAIVMLFVWLYRWIVNLTIWQRLSRRFFGGPGASIVEFYERMLALLASKGLIREPHQTPLEFAVAVGSPAVLQVTEVYNAVRFGSTKLTAKQLQEIELALDEIGDFRT